jgi:hypothetical protein
VPDFSEFYVERVRDVKIECQSLGSSQLPKSTDTRTQGKSETLINMSACVDDTHFFTHSKKAKEVALCSYFNVGQFSLNHVVVRSKNPREIF